MRGAKPTVVCRESGVGTSLINNIETEGTPPSAEKVQLLADYLGVTTSELLGEAPKEFMRKAIYLYKRGNLAVDSYMQMKLCVQVGHFGGPYAQEALSDHRGGGRWTVSPPVFSFWTTFCGWPPLAVCTLAVAYTMICALVIFNVEPQTFNSFFEAVYWATVSLTTMGYGDIYPVTNTGRAVTMLSSLVGIAIIALPSGIITAGYMDELQRERDSEKTEQKIQ